jgi:hypothetical protein
MRTSFEFRLIMLLLLPTSGCQAGLQQIDGFYRYGHEVNTVCTRGLLLAGGHAG